MKKNGFTLVELIATITLIALIATVILINVVGMKSNQDETMAKRFKTTVEEAACTYIDLSTQTELRNICKSNSNNSRCNIPLSVLISDAVALMDANSKDYETNCTASQEQERVYVHVFFEGTTLKEKKCEFKRTSKEVC